MSWSVIISGHGNNPCGASCWYSKQDGTSKSASYSGPVQDVFMSAASFIEACQAEDMPVAPASEVSAEEAAE